MFNVSDLPELMQSMEHEIAIEVSNREEAVVNGHKLVVEEVRPGNGLARYGKWFVDGVEVEAQAIKAAILMPALPV